jgi:hypothetical protein
MGNLYAEHHEEDFFLYIAYSDENVYGNWAARDMRQLTWPELQQPVNVDESASRLKKKKI